MYLDTLSYIADLGFPIALSCYLLLRFETLLKQNTAAIRALEWYIKNGKHPPLN